MYLLFIQNTGWCQYTEISLTTVTFTDWQKLQEQRICAQRRQLFWNYYLILQYKSTVGLILGVCSTFAPCMSQKLKRTWEKLLVHTITQLRVHNTTNRIFLLYACLKAERKKKTWLYHKRPRPWPRPRQKFSVTTILLIHYINTHPAFLDFIGLHHWGSLIHNSHRKMCQ